MIHRTLLILTVVLGLLAAPLAAEAQLAATKATIGYLSPFSSSGGAYRIDAFRDELREHGYVDGANVVSRRDSLTSATSGCRRLLPNWSV